MSREEDARQLSPSDHQSDDVLERGSAAVFDTNAMTFCSLFPLFFSLSLSLYTG